MNEKEIIEMLRASCDKDTVDPEQNGFWVITTEELEKFAKLIEKKEHEKCATIAENLSNINIKIHKEWRNGCIDVAEVIRRSK